MFLLVIYSKSGEILTVIVKSQQMVNTFIFRMTIYFRPHEKGNVLTRVCLCVCPCGLPTFQPMGVVYFTCD